MLFCKKECEIYINKLLFFLRQQREKNTRFVLNYHYLIKTFGNNFRKNVIMHLISHKVEGMHGIKRRIYKYI